MVKTLDRYLINLFFKKLLLILTIFFTLTIILTVFEEITFFSDEKNSKFYLPFLLATLNAPTTILEILPFVMLISTQKEILICTPIKVLRSRQTKMTAKLA